MLTPWAIWSTALALVIGVAGGLAAWRLGLLPVSSPTAAPVSVWQIVIGLLIALIVLACVQPARPYLAGRLLRHIRHREPLDEEGRRLEATIRCRWKPIWLAVPEWRVTAAKTIRRHNPDGSFTNITQDIDLIGRVVSLKHNGPSVVVIEVEPPGSLTIKQMAAGLDSFQKAIGAEVRPLQEVDGRRKYAVVRVIIGPLDMPARSARIGGTQ